MAPEFQLILLRPDYPFKALSSRNYDPSAKLGTIKTPVIWVNSADDFINPPELAIAERMVKTIPKAHFVLIPASENTRGHGTHTAAIFWKDDLAASLEEAARAGR